MTDVLYDPLVDVDAVSFEYPFSSNNKAAGGIHGVNLRVHRGDRVLVVGHNGSGKSTLLAVVAGRRKASKGRATVLGTDAFDNTRLQQHVALIGNPWPPEAFFASTVASIASPAPLLERRQRIADALHLPLQRSVSNMSSGEKRRVQILHGMLQQSLVYLLDECSTDIDVAERKTVLELIKSECSVNRGCCLYATHIFDGVSNWATHVLLMQNGCVVDFKKMNDIEEPLEVFAHKFLARQRGGSFSRAILDAPVTKEVETNTNINYKGEGERTLATEEEAVIVCRQLQYKDIFRDLTFTIYKGERVLLCGCNGAGKSTLLNMMGGKQFFNNRSKALRILGKACYEDMTLNSLVAFGGDWWTVAPPGEVHVREMLQLRTPRSQQLCDLLDVDLDWDVRHISLGHQKRVQLLLHLLEDKPIVLLDEATSDLDLDQRHALLSFLYNESVSRGVTVVYATHIFGGLGNWPSAVMILDRTKRGLHAMWRSGDSNANGGGSMDWRRVTDELIALKKRENTDLTSA
ncbi:ABC transporter [Trypanosoma grayi]|uniref:ABC transporter n=1 Tax=Trypanosoma grayi TaxID=71804 RepID=UPI0004F43476|nr:ABC transporter [Trypanosoma grayi]KEG12313.1 ABC transporter [Trypanosoma grayi]